MLLRLTVSLREIRVTVYCAFNKGSSQLGKALIRYKLGIAEVVESADTNRRAAVGYSDMRKL